MYIYDEVLCEVLDYETELCLEQPGIIQAFLQIQTEINLYWTIEHSKYTTAVELLSIPQTQKQQFQGMQHTAFEFLHGEKCIIQHSEIYQAEKCILSLWKRIIQLCVISDQHIENLILWFDFSIFKTKFSIQMLEVEHSRSEATFQDKQKHRWFGAFYYVIQYFDFSLFKYAAISSCVRTTFSTIISDCHHFVNELLFWYDLEILIQVEDGGLALEFVQINVAFT